MPNPKKPRTLCLNCGAEPEDWKYKYCSNVCQLEYQRNARLREWKQGKISGLSTTGLVSKLVKNYLRKKFNDRCSLCTWSVVNIYTGKVPLVADHIDGNWRNNAEANLRLLCPNCDSLTATYAGANRGKSGRYRVLSKRALEAKLVVSKKEM